MYSFKNDYSDGGHPLLLQALVESAPLELDGYCDDELCEEATEIIKKECRASNSDVHFIAGGTLTNLTAISAFLRPHEAVISATMGHVFTHETGAIEATGHKVFPVNSRDGKLYPEQIKTVVTEHYFEHMVKIRLVYISQTTEIGGLYSLKELKALRKVCDELNLLLYIDGARLGSAIMSKANDVSISDYSKIADAFYIGATKNGALFGEALLINNNNLKSDFRYIMKQRGAIFAKGRLMGAQFMGLFKDGLYYKLAQNSNEMAVHLQSGIKKLGYGLKYESQTNQVFPIFPEKIILALEQKYGFYRWEGEDEDLSTIRMVCSWATEKEVVDAFLRDLKQLT